LKEGEVFKKRKAFQVDAFSGGLWLYSRELFEKLEYDENRTTMEHFAFSEKIREADFEIWVIPERLAEHHQTTNEDDYSKEELEHAVARGFVIRSYKE